MIKFMEIEDVDGILKDIYPSYFKEGATSHLTLCLDNSRRVVENYLNGLTYVAKDGDNYSAIIVARVGNTFYKEIECDIEMFYVMPEYRGNRLSREMVKTVVDQAEAMGAKLFYSSCLGGIGHDNEQLYINLFAKFGFERLGTVMMRRS